MRRGWMVVLLAVFAVVLTSCDWSEFGYNPAHTDANAIENTIGASNVNSLTQKWTFPAIASVSSPADSLGTIYYDTSANFDHASELDALSGTTGAVLWQATLGQASLGFGNGDSPAVANGMVYTSGVVASGVSDDYESVLYAFDATGHSDCSGTPKTCSPLWQFELGGTAQSVNVDNGVVYVASQDVGGTPGGLYALDAQTGAQIWSVAGNDFISSPTISNGVMDEVTNDNGVEAFDDTNGNLLWSDDTNGGAIGQAAVANGSLYVSSGPTLMAFDANGVTNCSGTPKVCSPLWTGSVAGALLGVTQPAVANGTVYIGGFITASSTATVYAFDANGVSNCSGTPKVCGPLWTGGAAGAADPATYNALAVANGLVYFGSNEIDAYDAAGVTNCTGTPKTCAPLWSATPASTSSPTNYIQSVVVAYGNVFIGTEGNFGSNLYDFALPSSPSG